MNAFARSLTRPHPFLRPCARRGFTLLELVLTISLIVVLVSIVMPNLMGLREGLALQRTSDDLRGLLTGLRLRAMQEGQPYTFSYTPGTNQYSVRVGSAPVTLPLAGGSAASAANDAAESEASSSEKLVEFDEGVVGSHTLEAGLTFTSTMTSTMGSVGTTASSANASAGTTTSVVFEPDGRADPATTFEIKDKSGEILRVTVRSLTGQAKLERINPHAAPGGSP